MFVQYMAPVVPCGVDVVASCCHVAHKVHLGTKRKAKVPDEFTGKLK